MTAACKHHTHTHTFHHTHTSLSLSGYRRLTQISSSSKKHQFMLQQKTWGQCKHVIDELIMCNKCCTTARSRSVCLFWCESFMNVWPVFPHTIVCRFFDISDILWILLKCSLTYYDFSINILCYDFFLNVWNMWFVSNIFDKLWLFFKLFHRTFTFLRLFLDTLYYY